MTLFLLAYIESSSSVYSGSWPDIPDQAWENALAGANRASKNTGRK